MSPLGWSLVFKVRGGMVRMPTCWTDDRQAAVDESFAYLRESGRLDIELAEAVQVESRGLDKRVGG